MTHYRMMDRDPSVLITSNRNELKVYQGNLVYLNNGDNFELRFFNPLQEKLGVEIIFNGVKKGDSYLVLNPGQDLILDRFLDEQRKMVFETYSIDGNNEAAVKAIEKNGLITFNFYKERGSNYWNPNRNININYDFPPKIKHYRTKNLKGSGPRGTQGPNGPSGTQGVSGTMGLAGRAGHPLYTTSSYNSTTVTSSRGVGSTLTSTFISPGVYTNQMDFSKDYWFPSTNNDSLEIDELETGRVEKGNYSDQKLKEVNIQFTSSPFCSYTYQILPFSQMNRNIGEVRAYCTCCGYRIRKESWDFCPKCGSRL